MKRIVAAIIMLVGACVNAQAATTLLPNGEQCFSATVGISGMIGLLGTITGGAGGTSGTYVANVTGGSGSGATATIVVSGGAVTAVTILQPGIQYKVGDVLSVSSSSIGGVTGFSVPVLSTAINGSLAAGKVNMFVPNTTTPKQTWQDPNQNTLNSTPITLDGNGCAIIYGTGSYRQQLFDSLGNLVWDQLTTDTSAANSTFWAGLASGTPNAIVVSDPGFSSTDGQGIQFIALSANTGTTTLNPGTGPIAITKQTSSGPSLLSGGEIEPNNIVYVVFSAVQQTFQLVNLLPTAVTNGIPVGFELSCPGFTAPANYMFEYGEAISRGTYNSLMIYLTFGQSGTLTSGSNSITSLSDTSQFFAGEYIEGTGIPGGTTISSFTSSTITMSANATASSTTTITAFPYGDGDGSTTFNVPDRRGRAVAGRDNMGGSAAGTLTATYAGATPDALGSLLGTQSKTLAQANLGSSWTFTNSGITLTNGAFNPTLLYETSGPIGSASFLLGSGAGVSGSPASISATSNVSVATQGSAASGGSSTPVSAVPPLVSSNICLKVQ